MTKCGGCGKFLSGGAVCTKCKTAFHKQCVNLTSNQTPKNWLCPCCVVSAPRKDNSNTPVKILAEQLPEESPQPIEDESDQEQHDPILEEMRALRREMNCFRKEFGSCRKEIREVRDEVKNLKVLYEGCNKRMDGLDERLDKQESRLLELESTHKETQDLRLQIHVLKQELQTRDQIVLQNDVEISGVTEGSGESVTHIVGLVMKKIGVNLDERDIVEARRVGPVRVGQDGKQRPRPIVLRLTRRAVRDEVFRCARARRGLTTGDLDLAGTPRPVFINERLTRENRLLFNKARLLCKQHSWKYAWTREGTVLIREADGKTSFRIRCENDFDRFFK